MKTLVMSVKLERIFINSTIQVSEPWEKYQFFLVLFSCHWWNRENMKKREREEKGGGGQSTLFGESQFAKLLKYLLYRSRTHRPPRNILREPCSSTVQRNRGSHDERGTAILYLMEQKARGTETPQLPNECQWCECHGHGRREDLLKSLSFVQIQIMTTGLNRSQAFIFTLC